MKPVSTTLTTPSTSMPVASDDPQLTPLTPLAPMPERWIEALFDRLAAIIGNKFTDAYMGVDVEKVKKAWSEALAGFSDEEMKRGIAACRSRRFPPNLPEFVLLCRPSLDPEIAWLEAEQGMASHHAHRRYAWSHPAVYWAAKEMQTELRGGKFSQHRKRWEFLLNAEWARTQWPPIPDPTQKQLAYQPSDDMLTAVSRTEAAQRLKVIKANIEARRKRTDNTVVPDAGEGEGEAS